ncbi:IS1380 family transposase [Acaryochloris sp. CCMEE 5410]|uniref:IS1380 family transposase n=1 Tax=Acaryochloris sp. CCMEE 5410 TaxID=310037 RepID=UPI0002485175|nr:IS1380 family transposase [Acaryochloris sp. CCMEE 5410]KAI9129243.1 IS1380 family transposase [Acaryochloris sp. CCMEE 5410]
MPPTTIESTSQTHQFGKLDAREIVADFNGGSLTSDAGLLLIKQVDELFQITHHFAECFSDHRDPSRIQHNLSDLVTQRVYGIVQGYEDLLDHDYLRNEPLFNIAVGQLESTHSRCAPLAGKSTLNRLEQAPHGDAQSLNHRYVRFAINPDEMKAFFVERFVQLSSTVPEHIVIDMDVSDDLAHGQQEQVFFNPYYHHECFAPLLIFCGTHLLAARLRPSNVDPAAGALDELQRIIPHIRCHWPEIKITVRADSAYARDDIMSWCEENQVDFVLAMATNERLVRMSKDIEAKAKAEFERCQTVEPPMEGTPWYRSLNYQTLDSWSKRRRVVAKVTYDEKGVHHRFVVTSFPASEVIPSKLYEDEYCPRANMENRIKEHQLELFSDRTSAHWFESNQLRLWWSSVGYVLLNALREHGLADTPLKAAQLGTIRLKLLKVAAQVRFSVRRIYIGLNSHCPWQQWFEHAILRLKRSPAPT